MVLASPLIAGRQGQKGLTRPADDQTAGRDARARGLSNACFGDDDRPCIGIHRFAASLALRMLQLAANDRADILDVDRIWREWHDARAASEDPSAFLVKGSCALIVGERPETGLLEICFA